MEITEYRREEFLPLLMHHRDMQMHYALRSSLIFSLSMIVSFFYLSGTRQNMVSQVLLASVLLTAFTNLAVIGITANILKDLNWKIILCLGGKEPVQIWNDGISVWIERTLFAIGMISLAVALCAMAFGHSQDFGMIAILVTLLVFLFAIGSVVGSK